MRLDGTPRCTRGMSSVSPESGTCESGASTEFSLNFQGRTGGSWGVLVAEVGMRLDSPTSVPFGWVERSRHLPASGRGDGRKSGVRASPQTVAHTGQRSLVGARTAGCGVSGRGSCEVWGPRPTRTRSDLSASGPGPTPPKIINDQPARCR